MRRRETDVDSPKSDQVFDGLVTLGHMADAVTCCATNSCLGWHAELATALCEARPTMSPTSWRALTERSYADSAGRTADEGPGKFRPGNARELSIEPG